LFQETQTHLRPKSLKVAKALRFFSIQRSRVCPLLIVLSNDQGALAGAGMTGMRNLSTAAMAGARKIKARA
jgi:hypothetical protein